MADNNKHHSGIRDNHSRGKEVALRFTDWICSKVEIHSIRQADLLHCELYHTNGRRREHVLVVKFKFHEPWRGVGCYLQYRTQPHR